MRSLEEKNITSVQVHTFMQQIASPTNDSLIQAQLHCPDEHFFFQPL